jgi:hypothetical protein
MSSELRTYARRAEVRFFGTWKKLYDMSHIQFIKQE